METLAGQPTASAATSLRPVVLNAAGCPSLR